MSRACDAPLVRRFPVAAAAALTLLAALPARAQDEMLSLPEAPPLPVERPDTAGEDADVGPTGDGEDDETTPGEGDEQEDAPEAPPEPPEPEDAAELRACRAALTGYGAEFERIDAILPADASEDGCGVAAPFNVSEILPGVTLSPETEMRCETALQLARWVSNEVLPAAQALDLGDLTALNHGSTYVCRPRNNIEHADISEHAKGNAIDIMSFEFDDAGTVAVSPRKGDGDALEAFQKAVGSGACLYFTTVLGPGAAYHDDHLHLDVVERESGWRLCQTE